MIFCTVREILLNISGSIYVYPWNTSSSHYNTPLYYICILQVLYVEKCILPNFYIEVQTPAPQNVALFGFFHKLKNAKDSQKITRCYRRHMEQILPLSPQRVPTLAKTLILDF